MNRKWVECCLKLKMFNVLVNGRWLTTRTKIISYFAWKCLEKCSAQRRRTNECLTTTFSGIAFQRASMTWKWDNRKRDEMNQSNVSEPTMHWPTLYWECCNVCNYLIIKMLMKWVFFNGTFQPIISNRKIRIIHQLEFYWTWINFSISSISLFPRLPVTPATRLPPQPSGIFSQTFCSSQRLPPRFSFGTFKYLTKIKKSK